MNTSGKVEPLHVLVVAVIVVIAAGAAFYAAGSSEDGAFKVGTLNTMTGDLSFVGPPFVNAEELAAKQINEAGGVLDENIVLCNEDTETTAAGALDAARKLIDVEGVDGIVGSVSTFGTMAVVEVVSSSEVPTISPSATAPKVANADDDDFLFRTCPSDSLQGAAIGKVASERGYETASVLSRNDAYGTGLEKEFSEAFESLGGEVLNKVKYDPSAATFDSYIEQARDGNPDVIQLNGLMDDGVRMLRAAADMGVTDDIDFLVSEGVQDPAIPEEVGKTSDNEYVVWNANVGGATPYPVGGGTFDEEYEEEYGEKPVAYCANAYDGVVLLALAVQKAGTKDGLELRDALRDVANPPGEEVSDVATALSLLKDGEDINYQGASGELTFDNYGDVLVGTAREWYYAENGEIVIDGEVEIPK